MRFGRSRGSERDVEAEAARAAWPNGFRAALSISFDDARRSQVELGLPLIDQMGIPATFYVLPDGVNQAPRGWHDLVASGHEVGNHTFMHPCSGNFGWSRHHAIEDLDLDDMATEIADADEWITNTLGTRPRTFAYPCGHTFIGRGRETRSFVPLIADRFVAGRTFNDVAINSPLHCDLAQVSAMNSDGLVFEQLHPILDSTLAEGGWLVLGGHEIGHGGDGETTMLATLAATFEWCRAKDVWIDTIGNVASRVLTVQQSPATSRRV